VVVVVVVGATVVVVVVVGPAVVVVVVGATVVVLVVLVVVVVGATVVVVVVVGGPHGIAWVIEFVQAPVDVTVTCVAASFTLTLLPAINSLLVAVDGVTLPTFVVRLKLGPKLAPKPAPNVNVITLAIFYNIFI
jgi:hypothetical protein